MSGDEFREESIKVEEYLRNFFQDLSLNSLKPSPVIKEIFEMSPDNIGQLGLDQIDRCLFALGQYLIFIRYKGNLLRVRYKRLIKEYERYINKKTSMFTTKMTVAEKIARVESVDDYAKEFANRVFVAESAITTMDDIVDQVAELNNNLKKIHDHKREELRLTVRERSVS